MSDPEARRRFVVERLVAELHRLVLELEITSDEWHAALAFLTEVGRHDEFILLSDVNYLSVAIDRSSHESDDGATPSNVLGPFWRSGAPLLDSPARICREDEPGDPFLVTGVVRSLAGKPIPGAILDVWQTAANRLYENRTPRSARDEPARSDPGRGRWLLRSGRPSSPCPLRDPDRWAGRASSRVARSARLAALHLHVRVEAQGYRPLTTMIYLEDDPWLGRRRDRIGQGVARRSRSSRAATASTGRRFDVALVPGRPGS